MKFYFRLQLYTYFGVILSNALAYKNIEKMLFFGTKNVVEIDRYVAFDAISFIPLITH